MVIETGRDNDRNMLLANYSNKKKKKYELKGQSSSSIVVFKYEDNYFIIK
jgi:hypothetical protein